MDKYTLDEVVNMRPLVFLCGPFYDEKDRRDRRTILRRHLSSMSINVSLDGKKLLVRPFALIIDKVFNNDELENTQNITLIEEIVAACAYKSYIFVDTMSTALELGLFSNSYSQNRTTALLPKDYKLFRPDIGYFVVQTMMKSKNIEICKYGNKRVNKIKKNKAGEKYVLENLIAFKGLRVSREIEEAVERDFDSNIENYKICISFTENIDDVSSIYYVMDDSRIKFVIPPLTLFYMVETYRTEEKIKETILKYFGRFTCQYKTENVFDYFLALKGKKRIILDSPFKYEINSVIGSMQYLIKAVGQRSEIFQQTYQKLKYSPVYDWYPVYIENILELFDLKGSFKMLKSYKRKAFVRKNLVVNGKKRDITMYASNSEGHFFRNKHEELAKKLVRMVNLTPYSYAYKKDCSTVKCVEKHIQGKFFLKLDISNFFNSISKRVMNKIMKCYLCGDSSQAYEDNIVLSKSNYKSKYIRNWAYIEEVLDLCFVNGRLPLGLVTSPILSNLYMDFFDKRFKQQYPDLVYTRYSDDMLISSSSEFDMDEVIYYIEKELGVLKLIINSSKLRKHELNQQGDHVKFLGLNIVQGSDEGNYLTVGKRYINMVSKDIANYYKHEEEKDLSVIIGEIEYIRMVSKRDFENLKELFYIKEEKELDVDGLKKTYCRLSL